MMNQFSNLASDQRRVQRLASQFNSDERLWLSLAGKRRWRRALLPWLSKAGHRQLDLLDFAKARPPQDCVALCEETGK
jgi:hypothetical protein